jgi:hypothetical protein
VIQSAETTEIARSAAEAFPFLDDEANTPKWNPRCVEVKRTSSG